MIRGKSTSFVNHLLASSFLFQMINGAIGLTIPIYAVFLGASPSILGIIGATGGTIYAFMPIISGFLSDKFGRKIFISLSTILYSISCILYLLTADPYTLISIKALEWVAISLFWPSLEALLVEASGLPIEDALKKFNFSWGIAMIIGPMIGGSLISALSVKAPFLLSSVLSLLIFLITFRVNEPYERKSLRPRDGIFRLGGGPSSLFLAATLSTFLLSFAAGIIFNIFPAHALNLGIPAYEIGVIMLFLGFSRVSAFLGAYWLKNRIGEANMFLFGSTLMALALAFTAMGSTVIFFSGSLSIFGFSIGLLYASSIARILKSGRGIEGRAAGLFECLLGLGYLIGSLSGGFAAELSPETPYILASLLASSVSIFHALIKIRGPFTRGFE
ncbi:MAG: MFS transporter [Candidatus Bathyarchaeia archaeon]